MPIEAERRFSLKRERPPIEAGFFVRSVVGLRQSSGRTTEFQIFRQSLKRVTST
jgi:hypothetical protein